MSKKEDTAFAEWVDEIVGEYPEETRESAKTILSSDFSREHLYRGTLRSNEFYRRLNELDEGRKELEAARNELYSWYEEEEPKQQALVAERDALKSQLEKVGSGDAPPAAGIPGFSLEDFAALKAKADKIEALDKIIPAVMADMAAVQYDAIKNNFDIDPREVMRQSLQHGVEPYKAYEFLTQDQRRKRFEADEETKRKKWIEEGRRQAITAKNGSPDQLPNSGPSVLDLLQDKKRVEVNQNERVNQALQMFMEEGSASGS